MHYLPFMGVFVLKCITSMIGNFLTYFIVDLSFINPQQNYVVDSLSFMIPPCRGFFRPDLKMFSNI